MHTLFHVKSNPVSLLPPFLHSKYFANLLIQQEYNKTETDSTLKLYYENSTNSNEPNVCNINKEPETTKDTNKRSTTSTNIKN